MMDQEAYTDIMEQLKAIRAGQADLKAAVDEINARTTTMLLDQAHLKKVAAHLDDLPE